MATPKANFPDIFNGLLFIPNLKFVYLPAPEIGLIVIDLSFGWGFQSTIFRKRWS